MVNGCEKIVIQYYTETTTRYSFALLIEELLKLVINKVVHFLSLGKYLIMDELIISAWLDSHFNSREQCLPLFPTLPTLGGQSITLSFPLNLL